MSNWRDAHNHSATSGYRVASDETFEAAGAASDGTIRSVASPWKYFTPLHGMVEGPHALVISDGAVVLARKKLFGAKVVQNIPILDFAMYTTGLHDSGMYYECYFELTRNGFINFLFQTAPEAEHVANSINASVALRRG